MAKIEIRNGHVFLIDGRRDMVIDVQKLRKEQAKKGFRSLAMKGIRPNRTFIEDGRRRGELDEGSYVDAAKARGREWMRHGGRNPVGSN